MESALGKALLGLGVLTLATEPILAATAAAGAAESTAAAADATETAGAAEAAGGTAAAETAAAGAAAVKAAESTRVRTNPTRVQSQPGSSHAAKEADHETAKEADHDILGTVDCPVCGNTFRVSRNALTARCPACRTKLALEH